MIGIDKTQRIRVGIFLLVAAGLAALALAVTVGKVLLSSDDEYLVRFEEGISGLKPGSPVEYNGVRIGAVTEVGIEYVDDYVAYAVLTIDDDIRIREGATAKLRIEGITGGSLVAISGGGPDEGIIPPGSEIPTTGSLVSRVADKADTLLDRLNELAGNLVEMTSTKSGPAGEVRTVAQEVSLLVRDVRQVVNESREPLKSSLATLDATLSETRALVRDGRTAIATVQQWIDPDEVEATMRSARVAFGSAAAAFRNIEARTSKQELGQTVGLANAALTDAKQVTRRLDETLVRVRRDLLRTLEDIMTGAQSLAEMATTLKRNPSALLLGGGDKPRKLP